VTDETRTSSAIEEQGTPPAGFIARKPSQPPMERVKDIQTPEPEWKGLTDLGVTRLSSAAETLLYITTRSIQNFIPGREIILTLLGTALRPLARWPRSGAFAMPS
jgi:hypothetical protein